MVTMVISCSRDMNSTVNTFLVNLSIADLLILVICTPTALIEVTHHPDRWILGFYLCKSKELIRFSFTNSTDPLVFSFRNLRNLAYEKPIYLSLFMLKERS